MTVLFVLCSFGELAGLYGRAGATRTASSTPTTQTLYKAAHNGPGQSATDCALLLNVRLELVGDCRSAESERRT